METVACCRHYPVAFMPLHFQSSRIIKDIKLNRRKHSKGVVLKRNIGKKHRLRGKPLAINAKRYLKEDPDEEIKKYDKYALEFKNNENIVEDSEAKFNEHPLTFVSSISSMDPLIDSDYFVQGSKTIRKNDGAVETEPSTLVRIPGLPDGSDGNNGAHISSCFWEWKYKWIVHYEKAGSQNVNAPAVLFLPGFGVGSFHYENQLRDLGQDFRVWAIDFLGQGRSLPPDDPAPLVKEGTPEEIVKYWGFGPQVEPWARDLVYSVDLWRDQIRSFVEKVIGEPIYVVGNSLGGFVGLYFAASYPHLVRGITLLNATPFWAFIPNPSRSPEVAKLLPWSGNFPVPPSARKLTEFVWSKISEPESIKNVLKQVYADNSAVTDELLLRILEATEHPAAAASFVSIIFAPQGELSFNEILSRCREMNIPLCLIYGREDPWVKPVWGQLVKRQVPDAVYYEVSPAGHCPHSEVPEVVNFLLRGWIKSIESEGSMALPLHEDPNLLQSEFWRKIEFERRGSKKSVRTCVVTMKRSFWHNLLSIFRSFLRKFEDATPRA
uniref:TSA: Wollemia nobilis Ref_Wollemi_Transcript_1363_2663 transcribed RNA sequence n=1 Tax=Wollemia nobilis TaxID=56998 RepID=A0A0C9S9C3_9CONI